MSELDCDTADEYKEVTDAIVARDGQRERLADDRYEEFVIEREERKIEEQAISDMFESLR